MQEVDPRAVVYLPSGQESQDEAPLPENFPARHWVVTPLKQSYPCKQGEQAAAPAADEVPEGQTLQAMTPDGE